MEQLNIAAIGQVLPLMDKYALAKKVISGLLSGTSEEHLRKEEFWQDLRKTGEDMAGALNALKSLITMGQKYGGSGSATSLKGYFDAMPHIEELQKKLLEVIDTMRGEYIEAKKEEGNEN